MIARTAQPALLPTAIEGDAPDYDAYEDEFVYGFRYVQQRINGTTAMVQVPLSLDDVLHPQLDDYVNQNGYHFILCERLTNILATHLAHIPGMVVLHDVLVQLRPHSRKTFVPDIIVVRDVHTFPQDTGYKPWVHGGHPVLIIEVTSVSTRHQDVISAKPERSKYDHYQQVRIPAYVIVDAAGREPGHAPAVWGYRLYRGVYVPLALDLHRRLWIDSVQVSLGKYEDIVTWFDADGNRLPTHVEQQDLTRHERARAEHAETQAEHERTRAEHEHARAQHAETQAEHERARAQHAETQAEHERERSRALEEELTRLKAHVGLIPHPGKEQTTDKHK